MGVYLYPNNTETVLKNAYIWQYPNVQIFDFQNDWALGWTAGSRGYGTPDYVSWQGWRIYRSSQDNDGYVYPPSSIFDPNTLKKVKIRMYKWIATTTSTWVGAWICNTAWSIYALWSNAGARYDRITLNWTRVQTADVTWEVVLELDFTGTNVAFSINWISYSSNVTSSTYTNIWDNESFALEVANWNSGSYDIYIRKVEITTA